MKNRINLIPRELRAEFQFSQEFVPLAIFAVFLLYATTSGASIFFMTRGTKSAIAKVKAENKDRHEKATHLISEQTSLSAENEKLKSLQAVLSRKGYWADMFKELSLLTPEDIWLTTLQTATDVAGGKLILHGEASSQKKVADFFSILEKSQYFKLAVMKSSELDNKIVPEIYRFEMLVPFQNPATSGEL